MPEERSALLHELLSLLEKMLLCGAEVYRVEETANRIGLAAGAVRVNAFVITSSIVMTLTYPDEEVVTETRRINGGASNDFTRLEQYNQISRTFCQSPMTSVQLHDAIGKVHTTKHVELRDICGSLLAAGSFAVFFGGHLADGLAAAGFGGFIYYLQKKLKSYCPNTVTFNLLCSFITGVLICLLAKLFPYLHADKIMIGDIMLLVPGVAITLSIRDMIVGDTISGVLRVIESVLWAAGIAVGFFLAISVTGGIV